MATIKITQKLFVLVDNNGEFLGNGDGIKTWKTAAGAYAATIRHNPDALTEDDYIKLYKHKEYIRNKTDEQRYRKHWQEHVSKKPVYQVATITSASIVPNNGLSKKLKTFVDDYYFDNAAMQSEVDPAYIIKHAQKIYDEWEFLHKGNGECEWEAAEKAYYNIFHKNKKR